jgi:hypothetical protein
LLIASQDDPTFVAEREYREKEKEKEKEGEKEREKEVAKEKTPAKASDKSDMSVQPCVLISHLAREQERAKARGFAAVGRSPSSVPSEREAAAKNRSRPKPKPRDKDSSKLKVDEVEIAAVRESGSKATVATSSKRMDKAVEPVLPAKEAAKESKTTTSTMTTKELKVADVAKDSKTADVVAKDSSKDSKREPKRDAKAKEITAAPAKAKEASTAQSKAKEEEAASQSRVKEAPAQSKAKETTAAPAKAKEASTAQQQLPPPGGIEHSPHPSVLEMPRDHQVGPVSDGDWFDGEWVRDDVGYAISAKNGQCVAPGSKGTMAAPFYPGTYHIDSATQARIRPTVCLSRSRPRCAWCV